MCVFFLGPKSQRYQVFPTCKSEVGGFLRKVFKILCPKYMFSKGDVLFPKGMFYFQRGCFFPNGMFSSDLSKERLDSSP